MKSFRLLIPRMLVILVSIALGLCLAFVVFAQSSNTVQGCYSNGNGSLRRVNSPSDCNNSETAISWNIIGPQGPQGIQGPPGPAGGNIGITGRWQGTLIGGPACGYEGTNTLAIIFIQLPAGDITGAVRIMPGTASSVFGVTTGSDIEFDTGGSGVYLTGVLQDQNNMSGTVKSSSTDPPCGTWSAQRIPANP